MRSVTGVLLLSITFLASCSSATPAATEGYPLDTRTGLSDVDPVLAAVASGDPEELRWPNPVHQCAMYPEGWSGRPSKM